MPSNLRPFVTVIALSLILVYFLQASKPTQPSLHYSQNIKFLDVYSGESTPSTIVVKNNLEQKIHIDKVKTSCGCTTVQLRNKTVLPGDTLLIPLRIDTSQKSGRIQKNVWLHVKDLNQPLKVSITGMVHPHPKSHPIKEKGSIFKGSCATCHVKPVKGKVGFDLYLAACAPCHGIFKKGLSGPALMPTNLKPYNNKALEIMISKGKGETMPAFGHAAKGPLDNSQIHSLISYLRLKTPVKYNFQGSPLHRGRMYYSRYCASCHGPRRKGPIGPDITAASLKNMSKEKLIEIIKNGLEGTLMVPFLDSKGGELSPQNIEDIANYLKR